MIKILCLLFISNAALICAQSSEIFDANENVTTTQRSQTRNEETTVIQTDGDQSTGVVATPSEDIINTIFANISTDVRTDGDASNVPTMTPNLDEFNRKEAEAEIKEWSENLDCNTSPLGEFKCAMLKKLVSKYFDIKTEDIQLDKLKIRIRNLIKKFEDGDTPMDSGMKHLLQKYKKFLV